MGGKGMKLGEVRVDRTSVAYLVHAVEGGGPVHRHGGLLPWLGTNQVQREGPPPPGNLSRGGWVSRVRDGEGTHNPGLPLRWLFSPKSCGDYPPEGRDNPPGTCDFHLEFFS